MRRKIPARIVTRYARMWPRRILKLKDKAGLAEVEKALSGKGVYILYWDDQPYYVGQTSLQTLFKRIRSHATKARNKYYNFLNFFSAFELGDVNLVKEVEAILIASVPSENRAVPRMKPIPIPSGAAEKFDEL